jgi:hypothetical protein
MPNWVISCHGYSATKSTSLVQITTRQKYVNCHIPRGVDFITYTEQSQSLSMAKGWELWELLVVDGNEPAAYAQRHKSKTNQNIIDYGLSGPHDASDWAGWLWGSPSGGSIPACGLFQVGDTAALDQFSIGVQHYNLGEVLNAAKSRGVGRVYYLACQALG